MNQEETLIERLFSVGERLPESLRDQLLVAGATIEPQLRRLIDDDGLFDVDARGQGWAPLHAIVLLGALQSTASIPRLLALLETSDADEYVWNHSLYALRAMDVAALEPCLAAYAATDDDTFRSSLASVLCGLGVRDERILALLLERFERDESERDVVASDLAEYGDPSALPSLSRALDEWQRNRETDALRGQDVIEISAAIERLGGTLSDSQRQKREQVISLRGRPRKPVPTPVTSKKKTRPGRNEPCWCNSGTKYKRCHLSADEASDRNAAD